jgi:hypothetical protein
VKLVFVLFFVSTGAYNQGSVTNYDYKFQTEEQCVYVANQLYAKQDGLEGRATAMCIAVQENE